jgi:hypothetical protein
MPYPASWILFDQLYRQFYRGFITETEYISEKWHLDLKYGELLHTRGLLSVEELHVQQRALWRQMPSVSPPSE